MPSSMPVLSTSRTTLTGTAVSVTKRAPFTSGTASDFAPITYTDHVGCDLERKTVASTNERKLSLGTRGLLTSTWASEGMWFSYPAPEGRVVADLNLSWDKRKDNPNEGYYWAAVRDAIISPVLEVNKYISRETNKVLPHGDCTLIDRFQNFLRGAVEDVWPNKPGIFALYPVYSSARGVAEMAKRVQLELYRTVYRDGGF